jgi:hypothetical protein
MNQDPPPRKKSSLLNFLFYTHLQAKNPDVPLFSMPHLLMAWKFLKKIYTKWKFHLNIYIYIYIATICKINILP